MVDCMIVNIDFKRYPKNTVCRLFYIAECERGRARTPKKENANCAVASAAVAAAVFFEMFNPFMCIKWCSFVLYCRLSCFAISYLRSLTYIYLLSLKEWEWEWK